MTTTRHDITVHLIDFPKGKKVHEAVTENDDGSYSVFIDSRLSNDGQLREYKHALNHIENGDFEKPDVQLIEAAAHGKTIPSKDVKKWASNLDRAMTRAYHRALKAAELLGMDYEDYVFAVHDSELTRGY